jgi:hypothetical protein
MLGFGFYGYAISYGQAELDGGRIQLWENSGSGDSCSITVRPGVHHYYMGNDNGGGQCENDQYTYFKLENIKSAVWILFGSEDRDGKCPAWKPPAPGWADEIKTIKNNFTSPIQDLRDLDGAEFGKLFKPGMIKTGSWEVPGESHKEELTCVSTWWCPASEKDLICDDGTRRRESLGQ